MFYFKRSEAWWEKSLSWASHDPCTLSRLCAWNDPWGWPEGRGTRPGRYPLQGLRVAAPSGCSLWPRRACAVGPGGEWSHRVSPSLDRNFRDREGRRRVDSTHLRGARLWVCSDTARHGSVGCGSPTPPFPGQGGQLMIVFLAPWSGAFVPFRCVRGICVPEEQHPGVSSQGPGVMH